MYLTLVFIVMIISGTFIVLRIQASETKKSEEQLKKYAEYIYEQIVLTYDNPDDFQGGFSDLNISGMSLRAMQGNIIDTKGQTIASTMTTDKQSFPSYYNSVVSTALSGTENFNATVKNADKNGSVKTWMSYGYPADIGGKLTYAIYVQMDKEELLANLMQTKQTLMLAVLLSLLLTCVLGLLFSNTITEPISILTRKSNMLAKGNLEQQIPVKSNDEIGQLTKSFNYMARELRKTLSNMENEKNKLEILVHNMTDGVLAFDESGFLIHANSVCNDMLEIEDHYFSLVDFLTMANLTRDDLKPNQINEVTLIRGEKYIGVSFIPYKSGATATAPEIGADGYNDIDGVVVVMHDITKLKLLDNMRKDFVANVSHEIRTPLTTIKSYAETLLDGALDDREIAIDFLNTINSEADRMALLAKDLLELSRLDNKQLTFHFETVNLIQLIEDAIRQNSILLNQKKQKIIFKEPLHPQMPVFVDPGRINQVLNNIITNAIKYSMDNARIIIEAEEDEYKYYVSIEDMGMGISKEDLGRIFERFYRVDKARSRAMGGTGLGLSIAKDIMEGHNGSIVAKSELGRGTTMILVFPKGSHPAL